MTAPLRTLLVGLGRIGASYVDDKNMARTVPFVTHAQVLAAHPGFRWEAAIDVSAEARELVRSRFRINHVAGTLAELDCLDEIEVAVLATPPSFRLPVLDALPNLRAVLVEKPLGGSLAEAEAFVRECRHRRILTQVNLTRRADSVMRGLAAGGLNERIGRLQCGFGVYGNGIINYATHTIDLVRMLVGEVRAVQCLPSRGFSEGPLSGDRNLAFTLFAGLEAHVTLHPVRFSEFREGSLDLWGDEGRLEILQEGLMMRHTPRGPCRSLDGAFELVSEQASLEPTGYGHALYDLYEDLSQALAAGPGSETCSPGASALEAERVVHAVLASADAGGSFVEIHRL